MPPSSRYRTPIMSYAPLWPAAVWILIVAVVVPCSVALLLWLKRRVNGNFNSMCHSSADQASSSGTSYARRGSLETMFTSPTSSSESWSPLRKASSLPIDKAKLPFLGKSEPNGVIFSVRNSVGCPTCDMLLHSVAMHWKHSWVMSPLPKHEDRSSILICQAESSGCSPPTTPPT